VLHGLWRWKQQRIGTYYGGYDVEGLSETSLDSEEQTLLKGRDSQPVLWLRMGSHRIFWWLWLKWVCGGHSEGL